MKTLELEKYIENKIAANNLQESYDNSGLIIGSYDKEIKKVLITLDITEDVVYEAKKNNCDLILSHHPILFKPLKRINGINYVERIVSLAIKNDISIYSLHTNLDNVYNGVNHKICDILNLRVRDILKPKDEKGQIGAGMIGMLSNKVDSLEFVKMVKEKFKADGIRYTNPIGDKIEKVAVCGGSGSFLLKDAIKAKADVFITSDFTYHQFFDAEDKIMIIDIGHYEFEQFTTNLIDKFLHPLTRTEKIEFILSEINTNPVKYM